MSGCGDSRYIYIFYDGYFTVSICVYIYDGVQWRMSQDSPSLSNTVSDPNKKMFGIGLHVLNEMHTRFPDLDPKDMGVVWYGAGLQGQLPVLLLLHPEVEFQIHTHKQCPFSIGVRDSLLVSYQNTSMEQCVRYVEEYRGDKKFAVLFDLDYHMKPSQLAANNRACIAPSVESESVHYDKYTKQYQDACKRVAACSHVLLVSTPFRMPWITSDSDANGHSASWRDPLLGAHEIRAPNMLLFPQFGSRLKSTEMRGLLVAGTEPSEVVLDWKILDTHLNSEDTASREQARAQFMLRQLQTYREITGTREGSAEPNAWAAAFIENSIHEMRMRT